MSSVVVVGITGECVAIGTTRGVVTVHEGRYHVNGVTLEGGYGESIRTHKLSAVATETTRRLVILKSRGSLVTIKGSFMLRA